MQNPLISVIIPVYNVSSYLCQCLDSVVNQTYKNLEIILVDDGSTDDSGKICDKYALNDNRITVIHKGNGGQASARNEAIKNVNGEYILYVDSDDYIEYTHIQNLEQTAMEYNADLVQCVAIKFWNKVNETKVARAKNKAPKKQTYTATTALKEYSYQRKFTPSPWCKLIKRELMEDLEFPVGTGFEDMAIIYKIIGRAHMIVYLPEISYYYRQRNNSTMRTKFSDKKVDRIRIAQSYMEYIKKSYPTVIVPAYTRYSLAQLQLLMELPFDKKYRNLKVTAYKNLKKSRAVMLHDTESPVRLKVMVAASYLGPTNLMLLGRTYARFIKIAIKR